MSATEVRLRGEGNVVWTFELPLSEVYADQVKAHRLLPDDDESAAALADLLNPPAEEGEQQAGETPLVDVIDAVSTHADANALAEKLGVEGFGEKSPGLDAKKQALHEAAAALAAGGDGNA